MSDFMLNMEEIKKIELSSTEVTAYFWVNTIKNRFREIAIRKPKNKREIQFVELFKDYTEVNYRELYLKLNDFITEDINNFIPKRDIIGIDAFSQDTDEKGHNRFNVELSNIIKKPVPDICLATRDSKPSVIYIINMFGVSVWEKSNKLIDLHNTYDSCYLLTGNKEELDYYNTLIVTIALLDRYDKNFQSTTLIKEVFCSEHKKQKPKINKDKIIKIFNYFFDSILLAIE